MALIRRRGHSPRGSETLLSPHSKRANCILTMVYSTLCFFVFFFIKQNRETDKDTKAAILKMYLADRNSPLVTDRKQEEGKIKKKTLSYRDKARSSKHQSKTPTTTQIQPSHMAWPWGPRLHGIASHVVAAEQLCRLALSCGSWAIQRLPESQITWPVWWWVHPVVQERNSQEW